MPDAPRNGGVSITTLGVFAALLATIIGGQWIVTQTQFSAVKEEVVTARQEAQARDNLARDDMIRQVGELKKTVENINAELLLRRAEFVQQSEFRQFEKRADEDRAVLSKRLDLIETTRPTTGELGAATAALRDRLDKLYETVNTQRKKE